MLQSLHLTEGHIQRLPPEIRDLLLDYVDAWGDPHDMLLLLATLREAHGPLLFLLDRQAEAHYRLGDCTRALAVIERRQRRSTTIASQALEARALLAAGYDDHARSVADDISQAHAKNILAITCAAEVYVGLGRFETARGLLEAYLDYRPHHLDATLAIARLAHRAGDDGLAQSYLQRLGAGLPSSIGDRELQQLSALFEATERQESHNAAQIELERRRLSQHKRLQEVLEPYTHHTAETDVELDGVFSQTSGPESVTVERTERRKIQLEAVRHFGFMQLRTGQIEAIATILRGDSILTVMPTGAGKSLCYQLPALMLPRATLVISPLIALMKDQVDSLPAAARRQATFINSTLTDAELGERMRGISNGEYKLIYAAPERLRQRAFLRALRSAGLDLFVVDEAHCVSLWGHDFRPDYLFIQEARHELGNPRSLAMTATAPPRVRDEIVDYLSDDAGVEGAGVSSSAPAANDGPGSRRPKVMTLDIFRANLHLSALRFHQEEEKLASLLKFAADTEGSGIIYVNSRVRCESLALQLQQVGVQAEAYHAGIAERGAVQDRFMSDATRVVVATVAFGMGIDKPDIRFIVHFHPPRSLAAYYQEVGRAGRDDKLSQGVLFYSNNDWANLRRWAKSDETDIEFLVKVYVAIANQLDVKLDAESIASRKSDRAHEETVVGTVDARRLRQVLNSDETAVRVAISMLERADLLSRSFDLPRHVDVGIPRNLPAAASEDREFSRLRKGLALRPGRKAGFALAAIADFMQWPLHETEVHLLDWQATGYLSIKGQWRNMLIELSPTPTDLHERLERLIAQSAALTQRRIDDVIGYATAETCRHGYISTHFGSPPRNQCDVCDNCTGRRPEIAVPALNAVPLPADADLEPMILDCLVSLPKPVGRSGLARILTGSLRAPVQPDAARHHGRLKSMGEAEVIVYVDDLLERNRLRQYDRHGYPVLAVTIQGRAEAEVWLEQHPELAEYGIVVEQPAKSEEAVAGDKYTPLQKALWSWRRRTAEEQGQPPYIIMSNELMLTIAEQRPQNSDDLAKLPGMGAQRLQHYGPMVLDLIQLHPLQESDSDLLKAQRTDQALNEQKIKERVRQHSGVVSAHTERKIFMKMQEFRQKRAVSSGVAAYEVANNTLLKSIARQAPTTTEALKTLVGFRSSGLAADEEAIAAFVAKTVAAESE